MHILLMLILLGLLQGCTEVLPVSSTGHVAVFRAVFDLTDVNLSLIAVLHSGAIFVIAYWFRRDILLLWSTFRASWPEFRLWLSGHAPNPLKRPGSHRVPYYLAASLVPLAIEGYLLRAPAEHIFIQSTTVPILLVINGLVILATARLTHGERTLSELSLGDYLLIGAIQGIAVLPGISRLGLTLCVGLWRRLNWYEAVRLTFILALPVSAGAILLQWPEFVDSISHFSISLFQIIITFACAVLASVFSLRILTSHLLERRALLFFGYYCCMAGLFSLTYIGIWL